MAADASYVPPARAGAYPVRYGNLVRPIVDGVPAFRHICRAIDGAQRSVWATIAFVDRSVLLPDAHGTLFDVLDRAAARGVDVRAVFWREPKLDPPPAPGWETFPGNAEERAWLAARGSAFRARWDHQPDGCHHQKSWIIDAGEPGEVAFVGGINVDRMSIVEPGHRTPEPEEHYHDVHCEIAGPCASDVHHNFVQRWNEASERHRPDGTWPPGGALDDLPFPTLVSVPRGGSRAQVTRTIRGRERSILESYVAAIDAARESIYVENQFFYSRTIIEHVDAALGRGVEITVVVPGRPLPEVYEARKRDPRLFQAVAALDRYERFSLAALAWTDAGGLRHDVYVLAKIMVVDGAWMTVGSANLERGGMENITEMNVACWDAPVAAELRQRLREEHEGLRVVLDPATYAT
jgi:phosphatidylserine/phosphatidylglycerophosphate/cardiolipin synthase-like enzyme